MFRALFCLYASCGSCDTPHNDGELPTSILIYLSQPVLFLKVLPFLIPNRSDYTEMVTTYYLFVEQGHDLMLEASDLAYWFGFFAKVVAIFVKQRFAFVHVSTRSEALRAVHELNSRYIHGPLLAPLTVRYEGVTPAKYRKRTALAVQKPPGNPPQPIWRFGVRNIDPGLDFNRVLELFRPLGTVRWSGRDGTGTFGSVILETTMHWQSVMQHFRQGTFLEGHRLVITHVTTNDGVSALSGMTKVVIILFLLCLL